MSVFDLNAPTLHVQSRRPDGRFGPGNPGRPKGALGRSGKHLVRLMLADFESHHVELMQKLRYHYTREYMAMILSIMPEQEAEDHPLIELDPVAGAVPDAAGQP